MRWFRNRCERRRENLCLLASGVLPKSQARELEAHVAECSACREYFNEMKSVVAPLAGWESGLAQIKPDQSVQHRWLRAIETAAAPATTRSALPSVILKPWHELIWPARRIWAGLAAVWVALAIFNFSQTDRRETVVAKSAVPAAEVRVAFVEQQRLVAEILGAPSAAIAPAEPPRRGSQSRSERREAFVMA